MASLQTCTPCNTLVHTCVSASSSAAQKWISQANTAGKAHGVNPAALLAVACVETNAVYNAGTGGIVQIGSSMLSAYNSMKGTSYTLSDLAGAGSKITTASAAVALSFDILGYFLSAELNKTNSLALSSTCWNGAICGHSGSVYPFGGTASWPVATAPSCYGNAVLNVFLASPWAVNPDTGAANSFYFADISAVTPTTTPVNLYGN